MKWTTELYDDKHDFVSKYGEELFQHLPNQENNRVLDLGCGTGTLTKKLSRIFQHVVGVDGSKEMIDKARVTYPELTFFFVDALEMTYKNEYDIVFSNAVFHWIPDHDKLLLNIKQALRPSGKLIC